MTDQTAKDSPQVAGWLMEVVWGYWTSQLLRHAAEMGLADKFPDGPRNTDELSAELGMHAPSFRRFLRSLAGMGMLTKVDSDRYALTDMGKSLRTGAPGAARSTIITLLGKLAGPGWENLDYSLRTGEPSIEKHHGMNMFEYMAKNPGMAEMFSETMVGIHGQEPPAVAKAYDFSAIGTLVDVGGATGNLLGHVLAQHSGLSGVLFDLPHVVADAMPLLEGLGVADRVSIEGGSFFERVPEGYDAYMMSHIIHDWDEQECATILGHCREAMKPDGKLLIVEMVLPEGDEPHPGKMTDMMMLIGPGGCERTASEYEALLGENGFRMTRVVPTESAVSVVEAVRA